MSVQQRFGKLATHIEAGHIDELYHDATFVDDVRCIVLNKSKAIEARFK